MQTRLSDPYTLANGKYVKLGPVSAILLLGTGSKFDTAVRNLRSETNSKDRALGMPDLFCILDEENFGLFGYDTEKVEEHKFERKYWKETCNTPSETLALFIYWLIHKMVFERITEQPIFQNKDLRVLWPSVMAPVIPRMHVDVSESGSQMSLGWKNETRQFEE